MGRRKEEEGDRRRRKASFQLHKPSRVFSRATIPGIMTRHRATPWPAEARRRKADEIPDLLLTSTSTSSTDDLQEISDSSLAVKLGVSAPPPSPLFRVGARRMASLLCFPFLAGRRAMGVGCVTRYFFVFIFTFSFIS